MAGSSGGACWGKQFTTCRRRTLQVTYSRSCLPRFAGNLEQHSVKGWGYNYLTLGQVTGPVSTLMACPDGQKKESFVQIYGQGFFVNYNSKLPFVIYVPQEYEVRYRLWRADNLAQPAMIE